MAGQTIFVGSKDICFFCLKETDLKNKGWDSISTDSKSKLFHFRTVSRFLEMDYRKIFNFNVAVDPKSASLLEKSDLTVSLCQNCSKVSEGFADMCEKYEMTKLKLEGYVQKVHELMSTSEKNKARVDKTMKRLTQGKSASDLFNASIMKNLRSEAIDKCQKKVKSLIPRVMVTRLTTDELGKNGEVPSKPEKSYHPCPFCKAALVSQKRMQNHISNVHPEQHFINYKDPKMSLTIFRRVVVDLLFQDVEASAKNVSCPYCEIGFECQAKEAEFVIKSHAIETHNQLLAEKLAILQQDPKLMDILSSCNPNGFTCPKCGTYHKNKSAYQIHRRRYCEHGKDAFTGFRVPCPFNCGKKVLRRSLAAHKKTCSKKSDVKSKPKLSQSFKSLPSVTSLIRQGKSDGKGALVSCKKCGLRVPAKTLKAHEKAECLFSNINESKKRTKGGNKISCLSCGGWFHPSSLKRHMSTCGGGIGSGTSGSSTKSRSSIATKRTSGSRNQEPKVECSSCGDWLLLSDMHVHKWQCPGAGVWNGLDGNGEAPMVGIEYESAEMESSQDDISDFPLGMLAIEMSEGDQDDGPAEAINFLPEIEIEKDINPENLQDEVLIDGPGDGVETKPMMASHHQSLKEGSLLNISTEDPLMEVEENGTPDLFSAVIKSLPQGITTSQQQIQSELDKILETKKGLGDSDTKSISCIFCEKEFTQISELKDHIMDMHFNNIVDKISIILTGKCGENQIEVKQEFLDGG